MNEETTDRSRKPGLVMDIVLCITRDGLVVSCLMKDCGLGSRLIRVDIVRCDVQMRFLMASDVVGRMTLIGPLGVSSGFDFTRVMALYKQIFHQDRV